MIGQFNKLCSPRNTVHTFIYFYLCSVYVLLENVFEYQKGDFNFFFEVFLKNKTNKKQIKKIAHNKHSSLSFIVNVVIDKTKCLY